MVLCICLFLVKYKTIAFFNFLKPEWYIPKTLIFKKVFPLHIYSFYFPKGGMYKKISACWTEQDQEIASKLYPELEQTIINKPNILIDKILEYLEY